MRAKIVIGFSLVLAACVSASAFGRDDRWVSGWGQGISEAIVTKGPGNRIYVTCGDGAGEGYTGITFTLAGRNPTGNSILLTFDNEDPQDFSIWDGRVPSHCHACASVYESIISQMKKHSSVHVRFENGDATRFTLEGAKKAIGTCTPDFAR